MIQYSTLAGSLQYIMMPSGRGRPSQRRPVALPLWLRGSRLQLNLKRQFKKIKKTSKNIKAAFRKADKNLEGGADAPFKATKMETRP
jgi:hypothetical protein